MAERKTVIALSCVFALLGVFAICGGGCVLIVQFGFDVMTEQIENEIEDDPVIVEHIGRIEVFEMQFVESMADTDEDVFVFRIEGTEGSGELTAHAVTVGDAEEIEWATLELDSGEEYPLGLDGR